MSQDEGEELDISIDELESEPHLDLADRYEKMLERQVNNLWNIDTKAWRAARLIGILLGVLLTGASIVSNNPNLAIASKIGLIPGIAIGGGMLILLISLFLAMVSILNVRAGFGPNTGMSEALQSGDVMPSEYPSILSRALAKSVRINNTVMQGKADYLRYTFATLYSGLVMLISGFGITLIDLSLIQQVAVLGTGIFICVISTDIITNQKYERFPNDTEDEESSE